MESPSHHLHSSLFHFLLLSPTSILLQSQSSLTRPCSSPSPLPSSGETFQLLSTPPQALRVPF